MATFNINFSFFQAFRQWTTIYFGAPLDLLERTQHDNIFRGSSCCRQTYVSIDSSDSLSSKSTVRKRFFNVTWQMYLTQRRCNLLRQLRRFSVKLQHSTPYSTRWLWFFNLITNDENRYFHSKSISSFLNTSIYIHFVR